jgi:hypothetical protein
LGFPVESEDAMPEFMDVHRGFVDITPEGLREATKRISTSRTTRA